MSHLIAFNPGDTLESAFVAIAATCAVWRVVRGKWITMVEWYPLFTAGLIAFGSAIALQMGGDEFREAMFSSLGFFLLVVFVSMTTFGFICGRTVDAAYWRDHLARERAKPSR